MLKSKLILLLIAVTFFAYFSSFGNPFIWDDEQFITSNQYIQQFDITKIFTTNTVAGAGVVSNYYRPLSSLSFAIDAKVWGQSAFGFHLTNLLFHIGTGIFLFLLLLEIGVGQWGSFFISLFFLIHPVQVEAVSYINSRGDSMYGFFLFASLWLFAKALTKNSSRLISSVILRHQPKNPIAKNRSFANAQDDKKGGGDDNPKRLFRFARNDVVLYITSVALYLLSILSKETAIAAFPLFFVIVIINVFKNKVKFAQSIQLYTSGFVTAFVTVLVVAGYIVLRLTFLNFSNTLNYYTVQDIYSTHLWIRLFTFAKVLWVYMGLLVFPYPLHMERSVGLVTSISDWHVWGSVLLGIGILSLAYWEIRKKHTANIFLGFCISACLLVPVSGIIPINGILYEHWLYVPMVGFFLMIYGSGELINMLFRAKREILSKDLSHKLEMTEKLLFYFAILLSILYIVFTIRQNNIWSNPITFYTYTLQFAPDSARLHNNLGMSLADTGNNKGAIREYTKALSLGYGYPQIYNNLGNAQIVIGDYKDAEINLKKALRLSPEFAVAKRNLLRLYLVSKQYDKALKLSGDNMQLRAYIEQVREK